MAPLPSRRRFLLAASGLSLAAAARADRQEILPGLYLLRGAVNTAVIERNGRKLLIDSGDIEPPADCALFTHHHPDQASGAARLAAAGTRIIVPATERSFFANAEGVWDAADKRLDHDYNCRPDLFTLRESVPVSATLQGGDVHTWEGLRFEAIETPGHTDGSMTYLVEIDGKRVAFTGDLIYGPGQIHDFYSLQKGFPGMRGGYWGFGGAVDDVKSSLDRVLAKKPDLLIPSHGVVMRDPARGCGAVASRTSTL